MIVKPTVSFLTADADAVLVTDVTTIVTSMTDNDNYVDPKPALPLVTTANTEFSGAMAAAADGGKQLTSAKKDKRNALVTLMRQLAIFVSGACDDDMTKLLSSGFPVQKPNRAPASVPGTPDAPKVNQGKTGEASAVSRPELDVYIYNWRVTVVGTPEVVVQHGQSTGARMAFVGLTPGTNYAFELNAVGTAGTSDWSDAGTLMVI